MSQNAKELFIGLRGVHDSVRRAVGMLPNTEDTIADDYTKNVLHAGAETLQLIDRVMRGEGGLLRPITNHHDQFQDYVNRFGERNQGNTTAAGEYVVVTMGDKRFLGTSQLVQRPLAISELREVYGIPTTYTDEHILMAKQQGQLEVTSDIGIKVSFSAMPLHAIHEVKKDSTTNGKLAASAAATSLFTSTEYTQKAQEEYKAGCHNVSPELSYSEAHFFTPLGMALAAATDEATLDRVLSVTAGTTALIQGNTSPTFANVIHMHHTPTERAAQQVRIVSESGIIGGTNMFDLTFWLIGWDKVIDGVSQHAQRQKFQISEVRPVDALQVARGIHDLSPTQRANTTVFTGIVGTAAGHMDRLQHHMEKLSKPDNLGAPIRVLFTGKN